MEAVHSDVNLADNLTPYRACPKLRKLTLNVNSGLRACDVSPLLILPLEELTVNSQPFLEYNAPVLRAMAKLKTINGKPAREVLDALAR